jgi:type IV pilus assembly protein PilV
MNARARGFTLVESLVALLLLSVGLLGAGAMLLEALRAHADAISDSNATRMVRDIAERIRANPHGGESYDTRNGAAGETCGVEIACDPSQRAGSDLAHFAGAVRAVLPGIDTEAQVEFEPAIGLATPDRYRISVQWRGPRDSEGVLHAVTLILLAWPVAGEA